jgi:hypothetical protein
MVRHMVEQEMVGRVGRVTGKADREATEKEQEAEAQKAQARRDSEILPPLTPRPLRGGEEGEKV